MRRERNFIGPAGMGGTVGLWGASSLIRSVQRGTISAISTTTGTSTITAVDLTNCVLVWNGYRQNANPSTTTSIAYMGLSVAGTTVTGTRTTGSDNAQVDWELIEYQPGVIKSVQRGTKSINGSGTPYTQTITAVNPDKSSLAYIGMTGDSNTWQAQFQPISRISSATAITTDLFYNGGSLGYTLYWQVVETF